MKLDHRHPVPSPSILRSRYSHTLAELLQISEQTIGATEEIRLRSGLNSVLVLHDELWALQ